MALSQSHSQRLHSWATVSPLLGAVFAPFSVLFDIPALTEPWFIKFDSNVLLDPNKANSIPDERGNIALSAIGIGFNIIANILLVVRFSSGAKWWRVATRLSVVSWILKVIIAIINLAIYGKLPHDGTRGEGFWCALVSMIICAIITVLLLFHWTMEVRNRSECNAPTDDHLKVRVAGRHFMTNVTLFVVVLAFLALLSSQIEHWTYLQGIYFSIVTFLTVGFGDFRPNHTITRVLEFFFVIIAIAQLGNIISMLVRFFDTRARETRAMSRAKYEQRRHDEEITRQLRRNDDSLANKGSDPGTNFPHSRAMKGTIPDLHREIEFLHRLGEEQEARIRLQQIATSLSGLIVFWLVGAAIFSQLEGWGYGTGMYFVYVSFLTIGYGDYAPITPAGRVVFVLYSLLAVPIMASFAVQAVQQGFGALSDRQYNRKKAKYGLSGGLFSAPSTSIQSEKKAVSNNHTNDASTPHPHKNKRLWRSQTVQPGESKRRGVPFNWSLSLRLPKTKSLDREFHLPGRVEKHSEIHRNRAVGDSIDQIVPHEDLAQQWHARWEQRVKAHQRDEGAPVELAQDMANEDVGREKERMDRRGDGETGHVMSSDISTALETIKEDHPSTEETHTESESTATTNLSADLDEDTHLTQRILELAISLEWRARNLLITHLGGGDDSTPRGDDEENGGRAARLILKADRNVQLRLVKNLLKEMEEERKAQDQLAREGNVNDEPTASGSSTSMHPMIHRILSRMDNNPHADTGTNQIGGLTAITDEKRTLEEVRLYREEFAGLLAAGSRLMKLKGVERALFERRRVRNGVSIVPDHSSAQWSGASHISQDEGPKDGR